MNSKRAVSRVIVFVFQLSLGFAGEVMIAPPIASASVPGSESIKPLEITLSNARGRPEIGISGAGNWDVGSDNIRNYILALETRVVCLKVDETLSLAALKDALKFLKASGVQVVQVFGIGSIELPSEGDEALHSNQPTRNRDLPSSP